ncbi:unnamed protein product [marine sediment metagenome]|uniref:Uncharacterized protein n=1 Tax=marine sediment metagenome TaxID=412755 RepID=X0SPW5_9ZZZZ
MAKRGRTVGGVQNARWLAEAEILADNPEISDIKMVEELIKRGIATTRQTVHMDRQNDLEAMSSKDIKETKSAMIKELDTLINIAYARASAGGGDSLRAMDKYDKLFNTKAKVLVAFERAKMSKKSSERPIINVLIGKPKLYKEKVENVEKNKEATE